MTPITGMPLRKEKRGWAYCPICTHTVQAQVIVKGKAAYVKPGQRCPRCSTSLEAASVVDYRVAA